jgi:hypothetical protein
VHINVITDNKEEGTLVASVGILIFQFCHIEMEHIWILQYTYEGSENVVGGKNYAVVHF